MKAFQLFLTALVMFSFNIANAGAQPSPIDRSPTFCTINTVKGTYAFNTTAHYTFGVTSTPIEIAGYIHLNGLGGATFQTTDNAGGGSGPAPSLTTVQGTYSQVPNDNGAKKACVFSMDATLLVTGDNCPLPIHLNLFAKSDGGQFYAIQTLSEGLPAVIASFKAERADLRSILVDLPLSQQGTCGGG